MTPGRLHKNSKSTEALRARKLEEKYRSSLDAGLINENKIRRINDNYKEVLNQINIQLSEFISDVFNPYSDNIIRQIRLKRHEIQEVLDEIEYEDTEFVLPSGSQESEVIIDNIRCDHFTNSPAIQKAIADDLMLITDIKNKLIKMDDMMYKYSKSNENFKLYCELFFIGAIMQKGTSVYYGNLKEQKIIPLSSFENEYEYRALPLFQGYITFAQLDDKMKLGLNSIVKRIVNEDTETAISNTKKALMEFSDDALERIMATADLFPEKYSEIKWFYKSIKEECNTFASFLRTLN